MTQPVGAATIAEFFGVDIRRVQQLTQEGVITAEKVKGVRARQYDLVPTIQSYIRYLKDRAEGRWKSATEQDLKEQKLRAEIALKESQGELHRLKTDIANGQYISREEVAVDYQRFFLVFKKMAMAIPPRVARQIAGFVDPVIARGVEKDLNDDITVTLRSFVVAGEAPPTLAEQHAD